MKLIQVSLYKETTGLTEAKPDCGIEFNSVFTVCHSLKSKSVVFV